MINPGWLSVEAANELNDLIETVNQLKYRTYPIPPLVEANGCLGLDVTPGLFNLNLMMPAIITGGTNPYSWVPAIVTSGGAPWTVDATRSGGTTSLYPAFEVNGNAGVQVNAEVWLTQGAYEYAVGRGDQDWLFWYSQGSTSSVTINVSNSTITYNNDTFIYNSDTITINNSTITINNNSYLTISGETIICGPQAWCCYSVPTFTGVNDDWAQPAIASGNAKTVYLIGGSGSTKLTGIKPLLDSFGSPLPQVIVLLNVSGVPIFLPNRASSTSALNNRFSFQSSIFWEGYDPQGRNINPQGSVTLWYNTCGTLGWQEISNTNDMPHSGAGHGSGMVGDPGPTVHDCTRTMPAGQCCVNFWSEDGVWYAPFADGFTGAITAMMMTGASCSGGVFTPIFKTLTINVSCGKITSWSFA